MTIANLSPGQWADLAFVVANDGVSVYTPTYRSLERYGSLQSCGFVEINEKIINGGQETMLRVLPTDAGRAALKTAMGKESK